MESDYFGESDRPQEGEDRRDSGFGDPKATKKEKEELRRLMDGLSGGKAEGKKEGVPEQDNTGEELSEKEQLRRAMDAFTEKAKAAEENDKAEAERLSKQLKEQID
jgi:polyhydroxyalkanoate synthesis regulator protein